MRFWRSLAVAIFVCLSLVTSASAGDRLVIAVTRGGPGAAVWAAVALDAFKREGLDVQVTPLPSATEIAVAVASGDAQVGITGLSAAFFNMAGKNALRVIGGSSVVKPGYHSFAYIVTPAAYDRGVREPRDLVGRTIGISTLGSPMQYAMILLAAKYGLDLSGTRLVQLHGISQAAAALKGSQIDATLLPSAMAQKMAKAGDGRIIGWADDETPFQLGGIFVAAREIAENRPLIQRFVKAYLVGANAFGDAFLRLDDNGKPVRGQHYDELLALMSKATSVDPHIVEENISYWDPQGRLRVKSVFDQIEAWQKLGLVDATVDPRQVVDLSFIDDHLDVPSN